MNTRTINQITSLVCLCGALACCGCAHVTGNKQVYEDAVAFIQPGKTTRAEVIENLGQPTWEWKQQRLISYLWETTSSTILVPSLTLLSHEVEGETMQRAFCVTLDESNRVARIGFTKSPDLTHLKTAIVRWSGANLSSATTDGPYPDQTGGSSSSAPPASATLAPGRIALAYGGDVPGFDLQIADTKTEVAGDTGRTAFLDLWGGLPAGPIIDQSEWANVIPTLPFAALPMLIGGIHGAIAGVPAKEVERSTLILGNAMAEVRAQDALRSQLLYLLWQKNPTGLTVLTNSFPPESEFRPPSVMDKYRPIPPSLAFAPPHESLCAGLRNQGFGTLVMLRVINHGLSGRDGHNSALAVNMAVRATFIRVADGLQGESFCAQYSSPERKFTEWAVDNGQPFREEFEHGLQSVAAQIAARIPAAPPLPGKPLEIVGVPVTEEVNRSNR